MAANDVWGNSWLASWGVSWGQATTPPVVTHYAPAGEGCHAVSGVAGEGCQAQAAPAGEC